MSNDRRNTFTTQQSLVSRARKINIHKNRVEEKERDVNISLTLENVQRISEQYLSAYPSLDTIQLKEITSKFGPDFSQYFIANYKPSKLLGQGSYGSVLAACKNRYTCVAVKIQEIHSQRDFQREIDMQTKFAMLALAPALNDKPRYFEYNRKEFALLSMERVDGDLISVLEDKQDPLLKDITLLANAITDMIGLLVKHNLTHGDFSVANMAYVYNNDAYGNLVLRPILIDMFWSTDRFSDPEYDTLQMLRTLLPNLSPQINTAARDFLIKHLLKFYKTNWGTLKIEDIEAKWEAKSKNWEERIGKNQNKGNRKQTSQVSKSVSIIKELPKSQTSSSSSRGNVRRTNIPRRRRSVRRVVRSFY
jgi:tRNA A-37 threonylcarbamoyl transferase component Bud32